MTEDYFYTIDVGVNFASKKYSEKGKIDKIIKDSYEQGVAKIISISNSPKEMIRNSFLVKTHNNLYYTAGCHPHNASIMRETDYQEIEKIIKNDIKCVALGECGLDYNRMFSDKNIQIEIFRRQIIIAKNFNKPLYLHCRDAFDDFVKIIEENGYYNGVIHCFTGTSSQAKKFIEMGFYIGITGWLFDKRRNNDLILALNHIPTNRILVETDAPWLSIQKGRDSYPTDTGEIVMKIAKIKNIDPIILGKQIYQNSLDIFSDIN